MFSPHAPIDIWPQQVHRAGGSRKFNTGWRTFRLESVTNAEVVGQGRSLGQVWLQTCMTESVNWHWKVRSRYAYYIVKKRTNILKLKISEHFSDSGNAVQQKSVFVVSCIAVFARDDEQ